jgi:tRNA A37 threonylcarbamoyladenosine dehydratase
MVTSFSEENGEDLLMDIQVAADALDNVPARLEMAGICDRMDIPLVHAASAAGTVRWPRSIPVSGRFRLFANFSGSKGIEEEIGNTSFTLR